MVCVARRFGDRLVYKHRKRHRMWPTPPHSEQLSLLQPGKRGLIFFHPRQHRSYLRTHSTLFDSFNPTPIQKWWCALFEWHRASAVVDVGALLLADPRRSGRRLRSCRCRKKKKKEWILKWLKTGARWHKITKRIFFWSDLDPCPRPHMSHASF